jgi:hypothetical protein
MDETLIQISDVVRFEVPGYADVDAFCERIRARWPGTKKRGVDDVWLVSARVRRSKKDLALLLREVEAYVADTGLLAIRYHVDGRAYVMAATVAEHAASA